MVLGYGVSIGTSCCLYHKDHPLYNPEWCNPEQRSSFSPMHVESMIINANEYSFSPLRAEHIETTTDLESALHLKASSKAELLEKRVIRASM